MDNLLAKPVSKAIKVSVVRIEEIFQNSNPYKQETTIIKDYVYLPEKRIIA